MAVLEGLAAHAQGKDAQREADRAAAVEWARTVIETGRYVLLDTETTGLDGEAEVVQVAVLALDGEVLLETLVRPTRPIPWVTTTIHGISDADVADAPTYPAVHARLAGVLRGRTVVSYNAAYDRRLLRQTAARHGLRPPRVRWECAMLQYARYVGEWDYRKNDYRWPRLPALGLAGSRAHTAAGDCRATLSVLRRMAGLPELAGLAGLADPAGPLRALGN